jgi:hypothetical protein
MRRETQLTAAKRISSLQAFTAINPARSGNRIGNWLLLVVLASKL